MNQPADIEPGFQNYIADTVMYLWFGSFLHIIIFVILLFIVVPFVHIFFRGYVLRAVIITFLAVFSFMIGGWIGHLYWGEYIWNEVYYSPDYVIDFWYFYPTTDRVLYPPGWDPGYMIGHHEPGDITKSWWQIAPICWFISVSIFYILASVLTNNIMPNKPVQPTVRRFASARD